MHGIPLISYWSLPSCSELSLGCLPQEAKEREIVSKTLPTLTLVRIPAQGEDLHDGISEERVWRDQ